MNPFEGRKRNRRPKDGNEPGLHHDIFDEERFCAELGQAAARSFAGYQRQKEHDRNDGTDHADAFSYQFYGPINPLDTFLSSTPTTESKAMPKKRGMAVVKRESSVPEHPREAMAVDTHEMYGLITKALAKAKGIRDIQKIEAACATVDHNISSTLAGSYAGGIVDVPSHLDVDTMFTIALKNLLAHERLITPPNQS